MPFIEAKENNVNDRLQLSQNIIIGAQQTTMMFVLYFWNCYSFTIDIEYFIAGILGLCLFLTMLSVSKDQKIVRGSQLFFSLPSLLILIYKYQMEKHDGVLFETPLDSYLVSCFVAFSLQFCFFNGFWFTIKNRKFTALASIRICENLLPANWAWPFNGQFLYRGMYASNGSRLAIIIALSVLVFLQICNLAISFIFEPAKQIQKRLPGNRWHFVSLFVSFTHLYFNNLPISRNLAFTPWVPWFTLIYIINLIILVILLKTWNKVTRFGLRFLIIKAAPTVLSIMSIVYYATDCYQPIGIATYCISLVNAALFIPEFMIYLQGVKGGMKWWTWTTFVILSMLKHSLKWFYRFTYKRNYWAGLCTCIIVQLVCLPFIYYRRTSNRFLDVNSPYTQDREQQKMSSTSDSAFDGGQIDITLMDPTSVMK